MSITWSDKHGESSSKAALATAAAVLGSGIRRHRNPPLASPRFERNDVLMISLVVFADYRTQFVTRFINFC